MIIEFDKLKSDSVILDNPDLLESIREKGLLIPLLVSKDYTVIDGRQRYEALRQLGYKDVAVRICDVTASEIAKVQSIHKISIDPEQYRRALIVLVKTNPELPTTVFAEKLGITVSKLTQLLQLKEEVAKSVINGTITLSEAICN